MSLLSLWVMIFCAVALSTATMMILHRMPAREAAALSTYPIIALFLLAAIWRRRVGLP